MSKYFNETLKARSLAIPGEFLKPASESQTLEKVPDADKLPASENLPFDVEETRVEEYRKIQLPLEKLPHVQFKDSNSLEPAEESYRALRTRLLRIRSTQGIQSVVITSAVQGDGKTLTSLNLALCCAQLHGMRVLLIDADVRNCGLSRAIDTPPGPGLADVLAGKCTPEQAILETDRPNLYVVSSGAPTMPAAELFANSRWLDFVAWSKENFKLILVDSPPALNLSDVELITAGCDGVLMVVRALYTKRETLQKCVRQLDSKKLLGVVYNGVQEGSHHRYRYQGYGRGGKD
jgi:protein-tyrosine kinase